jgi:hypothetical protein
MKTISLTLILLFVFFWSNAQIKPRISYRENFFGNHVYLADGQKVKAEEIEKIMATFPEDAELFSKANHKIVVGESLRWGAWALVSGSLIYLFSGEITNERALIVGGMTLGALTLTAISVPLKRDGKREASNVIESYNYKVSRGFGYQPSLELKISPLAMGLSLNF